MKLLLSILVAVLLSPPTLALGSGSGAPRGDDGLAADATCKKKKKKRRGGGTKKPPPAPEPVAAPEPAAAAPAPAAQRDGAESILDAGDGDLTGMGDSDAAAGAAPPAATGLRRSNRMEFDARLIKGQTATSGAVYLFQRAPRHLPPLLSMRQSYLKQIVEPVLGKENESENE